MSKVSCLAAVPRGRGKTRRRAAPFASVRPSESDMFLDDYIRQTFEEFFTRNQILSLALYSLSIGLVILCHLCRALDRGYPRCRANAIRARNCLCDANWWAMGMKCCDHAQVGPIAMGFVEGLHFRTHGREWLWTPLKKRLLIGNRSHGYMAIDGQQTCKKVFLYYKMPSFGHLQTLDTRGHIQ